MSVPPQRVAPTSAAAAPPGGSDDGDTTASQDRVSLTDEEETLLAALPIPPECLAAARRSEPPRPGASALAGVRLPRDVPGTVEIRTMEDDLGDETEVRTLPGMPPMEGDTTPSGGVHLSPRPLVSPVGEARRQRTLSGLAPPTGQVSLEGDAPTARVARSDVLGDAYDADDSITTRGPPVDIYAEESVTSRAPPLKAPFPEEDTYGGDDGTEGTTQKVRRRSLLDEADSITARAPGHLTNMLRVLASNDPPRLHDDDEVPENHTALMPNAPPQRPPSNEPPQRLAANAPPHGPVPHGASSESRLRAAAAAARAERASLGALGLPELGPANLNLPGDPMTSSLSRSLQDGSLAQLDIARQAELMRGPRYGLLVGVVAAICLVVPIALFVALNHAPTAAVPRTASERAPDVVSRDEPARQKATRSAKPAPEAEPAPPRPSPLRRR